MTGTNLQRQQPGAGVATKKSLLTSCEHDNQSDNSVNQEPMPTDDGTVASNSGQSPKFDSYQGEKYWQMRYEQLKHDYDHLQSVNQKLEDKLLTIVDTFNKKNDELMAAVEREKSTLMADVNKLSNKLVDARIKLHDYEEKEILHAAECSSPCHRGSDGAQPRLEVPIMNSIHNSQPTNTVPPSSDGQTNPAPSRPNLAGAHRTPECQQQMIEDPNLV